MYNKILRAVERNVNDDKAIFINKPCPDIKSHKILYKDEKFSVCDSNCNCENINNIIFILESPHKSEFNKNNEPIGPAQKQTGAKFNKAIINFLVLSQYHYKCFKSGCYQIWLMNAVQYQVSLGINPENYRSILFQIAWHSFAEKDFEKRLTGLVISNENTVIFNTCTKGNKILKLKADKLIKDMKLSRCFISKLSTNKKDINLNLLVKKAIDNCEFTSYVGSHPSLWDVLIS